jgi:hypothetical protein
MVRPTQDDGWALATFVVSAFLQAVMERAEAAGIHEERTLK